MVRAFMANGPRMADETMKERALRLAKRPDLWIFLAPLIYYAILIRTEITFGDGPELLVAAHNLGVPHPSGYPLWTILAFVPAHLPLVSPYWNVALFLSALPTAIAGWAIFQTLRHLKVNQFVAGVCVGVWTMNYHVAYQATRIEVYALHCALIALSYWALVRFMMPRGMTDPDEDPDEPLEHDLRWAYAAVLFACLALANHLTSVFMVLPVLFGMLSADHRNILKPKPILTMFAIAAACASIYFYLPLSAMANSGDRITWNDPQTLERFWFHVTGKEYTIFRRYDKIWSSLEGFWNSLNRSFFPGIVVIVAIGLYDWLIRHWRSIACIIIFVASYLAYIATYPINDVSTYYTGIFIPVIVVFGVGLDWLLRVRFRPTTKSRRKMEGALSFIVMVVLLSWVIGLATYSRANHYREAVANDMSTHAMSVMEDPAIVFTSVDGHTFPMWYQTLVAHPDRKVVVVDAVMFHLKNKQWYRDHLRENYDWVEWPTDDIAMSANWRDWMVDNNPNVNIYAFLDKPWPSRQSYPELIGWHHRIHKGKRDPLIGSTRTRHAYIARVAPMNGHTYFHDSRDRYKAGAEKLACVVEWWKTKDFAASWTFIGPDDEIVSTFPHHAIPEGSTQSWEYLEIEQQRPGQWRCEVKAPNEPVIVREFVLE